MRRVQIYADWHLRGPGVRERTEAFKALVLVLMLLRVFDVAEWIDVQSGAKRAQKVDWNKI